MGSTSVVSESRARAEARKLWTTSPCGAVLTGQYDRDFFRRVEAERYRQQYWQLGFFEFDGFGNVLEVGSGLGTDLKQFARNGARCHGIDITRRHLDLAAANFETEGLTADLREADATALPFPDNYFDCVYSFGVLHHIPDVGRALAEIRRVLKPGGVLQTAVYHRTSLAALAHFARAAFNLSLFRGGASGVLAGIEAGARETGVAPYVKLYSRSEWRRLAERAGFATGRVSIRQVNFERWRMLNAFRPLERLLGWYVCGKFVKRHSAIPITAQSPPPSRRRHDRSDLRDGQIGAGCRI